MIDIPPPRWVAVCVDLDGTLNLYKGWEGENSFADPRPGAKAFMAALKERYVVYVFTTRDKALTARWLETHGIPYDEVTLQKVPAKAYIDDRAVPFEGSFDGLLERIDTFKAHWEREP